MNALPSDVIARVLRSKAKPAPRVPGPVGMSRSDRGELNTRSDQYVNLRNSQAYDRVNRVFNTLLPSFGRNAEMPLVNLDSTRPDGGSTAGTGGMALLGSGRRKNRRGEIGLSYGETLGAAPNSYGTQGVLDALLHEFAHVFQPRYARFDFEGGADAFAILSRNLAARAAGYRPPAHPYSGYPGSIGERFLKQHGRDYALRGQFKRA